MLSFLAMNRSLGAKGPQLDAFGRSVPVADGAVRPSERLVRMASSDDVNLVTAIAGGDAGALASLYDRYSGLLLAVAERIIGIRREAEDLVHDLFIEVWQRAGDYQPDRASVRTWLLIRLRSRAIDRKRSSRVSRSIAFEDSPIFTQASAASSDYLHDEPRVRAALEGLTPDHREVLLLGYFEDLSCAEIAERVGVPIGTVKSRIAAARGRLRGLLEVVKEGRA